MYPDDSIAYHIASRRASVEGEGNELGVREEAEKEEEEEDASPS